MMELKPCPFCRASVTLDVHPIRGSKYVRCPGCDANGPDKDPDGSKWNALPRMSPEDAELLAAVSEMILADLAYETKQILFPEYQRLWDENYHFLRDHFLRRKEVTP